MNYSRHFLQESIIDFETRCEVDVKKVGAYNYARHPSCKILMMSYNTTMQPGGTKIWTFDQDHLPEDFLTMVQAGRTIHAWNSYFEYCVWTYVAVPKLGWPPVHIEQFGDPSAKARAMALPAKLEECALALNRAEVKNPEGTRLISKFSTPRGDGTFIDPLAKENTEDWKKFQQYCIDDTEAELGIHLELPDMPPIHRKVELMIARMNLRGVYIDATAVQAADNLTQEVRKTYNAKASKLSEGKFEKCTQRQKVKEWCHSQGVMLPNMQGKTINKWLKKGIPAAVEEMLGYYQVAGSTGASKFASMLNYVNPITHRVHELLAFHKARTARLGGRGIQVQNLVRPFLDKTADYDQVIRMIKMRDVKELHRYAEHFKVTPMQVLLSIVRSVITPVVGSRYISSDYAQIEARKLLWIAGDQKGLNIFRNDEDIYLHMASDLYQKPLHTLNKESPERVLGKETVLGCGYGVGPPKFRTMAEDNAGLKLSEQQAKDAVYGYRKKFYLVPDLWKELNEMAIETVKHKPAKFNESVRKTILMGARMERKHPTPTGKPVIHMWMEKYGSTLYLVIRKPSGNLLYYPGAHLAEGQYGPEVRYYANDSQTHKWKITHGWGGLWTENITQGATADLINEALLRVEAAGYHPVLQCHDEATVEEEKGFGSLNEYQRILCDHPPWLPGDFPLESSGWEDNRYRK